MPPRLRAEQQRVVERGFGGGERAIGFDLPFQVSWRQHHARNLFERCAEALEVSLAQGEAGSGGVPAEFHQELRVALGYQVQGVAQVHAGDGAARTLDFTVVAAREGDCGAVEAVLDARGNDADNTLVP